jgi:hypothetical protein
MLLTAWHTVPSPPAQELPCRQCAMHASLMLPCLAQNMAAHLKHIVKLAGVSLCQQAAKLCSLACPGLPGQRRDGCVSTA